MRFRGNAIQLVSSATAAHTNNRKMSLWSIAMENWGVMNKYAVAAADSGELHHHSNGRATT